MNLEEKVNSRINHLLLIQDQMKMLENLKDKLNFKISCNNNTGYDFCKIEDMAIRTNFPDDLKNKSGQTLNHAIAEVNEKMNDVISSFQIALDERIAVMYQEKLPVGEN